MSLPRLAVLFVALLLSACVVIPITPQTISGKYIFEGQPEGMWYGGESLVLGEGTFEYWLYTAEVVENPQKTRTPIRGRYKLDGDTITFLNGNVPNPQRTLKRLGKRFVLWTPKQIQAYRLTGRLPGDLLYQQP